MTSMLSSNSSSAREGVIPNPAAEFSPFAMMRLMPRSRTIPGKRSLTIVRPGRPKISPIKRMRMGVENRWYHARLPSNPHSSGGERVALVGGGHQFRAAQEIKIARWIQLDALDSLCVNDHIIQIPQVDV